MIYFCLLTTIAGLLGGGSSFFDWQLELSLSRFYSERPHGLTYLALHCDVFSVYDFRLTREIQRRLFLVSRVRVLLFPCVPLKADSSNCLWRTDRFYDLHVHIFGVTKYKVFSLQNNLKITITLQEGRESRLLVASCVQIIPRVTRPNGRDKKKPGI